MQKRPLPVQVANRLGRSFLVNVGYMGITQAMSLVMGAPLKEPTFLLNVWAVLKAAFKGTAAQSTWNLGVAENTIVAVEKAPKREWSIRRVADFKTLAISAVSTALAVANMAGLEISDAGMYIMTATGSAYYTWSLIKSHRWSRENLVREANLKICENDLTH